MLKVHEDVKSKFNLEYLDQNHIFNVVPNNFPMPKDGIMDLCFFKNIILM